MFKFWNRSVGPFGGGAPFLSADLLSTAVAAGVGDLAPVAVGDTDGNRLTKGYEDLWHPVLAEELRQEGQRRVENLLSFSEDNVNLGFTLAANVTIGTTTLELTGTDNSYAYHAFTFNGDVTGRTLVLSVKMQAISGADTNIGLRVSRNEVADALIDLSDGLEKRVTLAVTPSSDGIYYLGIDNRSSIISGVNTAATKILFTDIQLEDSTGRLGSEIIDEPDFDSAGNWSVIEVTASTATIAGDGTAVLAIDGSNNFAAIQQNDLLVVGETYQIQVAGSIDTGTSPVTIYDGVASVNSLTVTTTPTTYTFPWVAQGTTLRIGRTSGGQSTGDTLTFTRASVKRIRIEPSEYVSTGVGTGSDIFDITDFTDGSSGSSSVAVDAGVITGTEVGGGGVRYWGNALAVVIGATYVATAENTSANIIGFNVGTTLSGSEYESSVMAANAVDSIVFTATTATCFTTFFDADSFTVADISIKRIDHGANVDGVANYPTLNGNTVSDGTVGDGPELWTTPTTVDADWTDNGDGSYTADGSQSGSINVKIQDGLPTALVGDYEFTYTVSGYTAGGVAAFAGSAAGATISADGEVTQIIAQAGNDNITLQGNSTFAGTISNISVKQASSNVVAEATGAAIAVTPPQYTVLSGNSGSYISTPDSAAVSVTGDLQLIWSGPLTDWTPAADETFISKLTTGGQYSYDLKIATTGHPYLRWSADGTAVIYKPCTAVVPFANGVRGSIKATLDVDNGASGNDVKFFTSTDEGASWAQLGSTVTTAGTTSIFDGTDILAIGANSGGTSALAANAYSAQVYNGIGGTLVADYNAADANFNTPKSLTSSSTGEVYTINGDAYLGTAASPVVMNGIKGMLSEGAATEISGYSNDPEAGWTVVTTATVAQDAIGLSGAPNEAWTFTDASAVALSERQRNNTVANDSLDNIFIYRTPFNASPSVYPKLRGALAGGTTLDVNIVFDPSDGTYSTVLNEGTVEVSRAGDWWNVKLTLTNNTSGNTIAVQELMPAYNTDGTVTANAAAQGSTVFASCELYKTTWSYSPVLTTGGSTKARLADVGATLDLANWSDAQGSMSFVLTPHFLTATGADQGALTPDSGTTTSFIYWHPSVANRLLMRDGTTNLAFDNVAANAGDSVALKLRWGSSTMNFSVDGVAAAGAAYDGSFSPSGAITLFKSLTLGASMKDLLIYNDDKSNDWL